VDRPKGYDKGYEGVGCRNPSTPETIDGKILAPDCWFLIGIHKTPRDPSIDRH
jgi:hypothetical protein